jgi:hypothetical protein
MRRSKCYGKRSDTFLLLAGPSPLILLLAAIEIQVSHNLNSSYACGTAVFVNERVRFLRLTFGGCYERRFKSLHARHPRYTDQRSFSQDHSFSQGHRPVLRTRVGRISLPGNLRLGFERWVFLTARHGARTAATSAPE